MGFIWLNMEPQCFFVIITGRSQRQQQQVIRPNEMFLFIMHALFWYQSVNFDFPVTTSRADCCLDPVPVQWGQHVCSHPLSSIVHPDSRLLGTPSVCLCPVSICGWTAAQLHVSKIQTHPGSCADVDHINGMQMKHTEFLLLAVCSFLFHPQQNSLGL